MGFDAGKWNIPYADKLTHFVFYLFFAIFGCLCIRERTRVNWNLSKTIERILMLAIFYGILIEGLQYIITEDRMAEIGDVVANTVGAIVGIVFIRWYFSRKWPLKWKI